MTSDDCLVIVCVVKGALEMFGNRASVADEMCIGQVCGCRWCSYIAEGRDRPPLTPHSSWSQSQQGKLVNLSESNLAGYIGPRKTVRGLILLDEISRKSSELFHNVIVSL